MTHEGDADDARLLEEGQIEVLLAKYRPAIQGRCIARLRGHADADDVAQDVLLRLLAEFHRGRRYAVPYRVVVHQVVGWTLLDYFESRPTDAPLPEGWEPAVPDDTAGVDSRDYLMSLFEPLPEKTRLILELRYLDGLEHDEIAARLEMQANAVYQRLHQGHKLLGLAMVDG